VLAAMIVAVATGPAGVATGPDSARPTTVAATAAMARASTTPCAVTVKACVDLSARRAWLTDGAGHITYGPVPAHGGSSHAPTPKGTFHVLWKDVDHYSKQFDAPMPYSVFFYPGDAFHADNPATASNGCIHLTRAAAQRFFAGLNLGDQVQVV
jgi:lipoprotein-anchoring transpeptidase ErfK/SrfK